ncbi:Cupredoxin-like domain-containing protein [Rhizobium sp. RU35A]|uniref:cupredoxin domain-containing protein n=1 Tax=Rhizobium sp. RU35A TaxID=1907414 RepID=UPI000953F917|nr:cupredoxin domain-containing protein [Rhizobium sp. RU35A]SIR17373.1 Cupredoxin-like domain-containing protein [Rhizobium sp. RU35A]
MRNGIFRSHVLLPALLGAAVVGLPHLALADAMQTYHLTLEDHTFLPSHLEVPANTRFLIEVTNKDGTTAEFESYDMKFEKIVVGQGHVTAHAGPLPAGTYKFFDDYHPEATGTLTAVAPKE